MQVATFFLAAHHPPRTPSQEFGFLQFLKLEVRGRTHEKIRAGYLGSLDPETNRRFDLIECGAGFVDQLSPCCANSTRRRWTSAWKYPGKS
jgi:hypothetical protein